MDNVTLPLTGSGDSTAVVATDDAGAAGQVQIVKLAISTDGSATAIPADASGILVNLGSNNDVTVSGVSTSAKQDTIIGHLDGVEGLLTTIDADTGTLAGAVSGSEMQVDVVGALPAGTNNIGDVDVLSVPADPFGANADAASATGSISAKLRFIANTGIPITGTAAVSNAGLTELAAAINASSQMDVNIAASAATVAVSGTFWQATQPVSGTVTANLSATDNTVLDNIDTAVTSKYITGNADGVTTVTTAGTDVALAGSTACKRVVIQAQTDNTSVIAVGATGVDATIATGTGIILYPGDVYELEIDNLADIFIDSLVDGEGVRYHYFT